MPYWMGTCTHSEPKCPTHGMVFWNNVQTLCIYVEKLRHAPYAPLGGLAWCRLWCKYVTNKLVYKFYSTHSPGKETNHSFNILGTYHLSASVYNEVVNERASWKAPPDEALRGIVCTYSDWFEQKEMKIWQKSAQFSARQFYEMS